MGPEDSLETLLQAKDHLSVLRYIRAHKLREPNLVVEHGTSLLGFSEAGEFSPKQLSKLNLGNAETLAALEQLCVASLDIGNSSLAESCLDALLLVGTSSNNHNGGGSGTALVTKESTRYRKLLALCLESSEDYNGALLIYDALLKENPANSHAAKRKYCILAAQAGACTGGGEDHSEKQKMAYQALNEYLQRHSGDVTAWHEMAQLCLSHCDYSGAAYCYEEVLLACPLDGDIHTKLGEIYATIGGMENLKLARKHLAQAINLNGGGNLRAVWSLIAVAESYLEEVESSSSGGKSGKQGGSGNLKELEEESIAVAKELILLCGEKLVGFYRGSGKKMEKIVEQILKETSETL